METTLPPTRPAWDHRLQAVLALLGGEPIPDQCPANRLSPAEEAPLVELAQRHESREMLGVTSKLG